MLSNLPAALSPAAGVTPPPGRQCGRCRLRFDGHPDGNDGGDSGWWLCGPCRSILLPGRSVDHTPGAG